MWMESGIEMETSTGGGLMSGLKRKLAGESFFVTTFSNSASEARTVGFAAPTPGKILCADLSRGTLLCQRNSYLCSTTEAEISIAFTKRFGAGFFGGEGFILQKISGTGLAFLHASGSIIERELAAGEDVVSEGDLVPFEPEPDALVESFVAPAQE